MPHDPLFTLNEAQYQKLNPSYDGAYYVPACQILKTSALSKGVQQSQVKILFRLTAEFRRCRLFLKRGCVPPPARLFCEATICKDVKQGHLGSYLHDGFCESLLLQIVHELRHSLPTIFAGIL